MPDEFAIDKSLYPNLYPAETLEPADQALDQAPEPPPRAKPSIPIVRASKPGGANRTICGLRETDAFTVHRTEIGRVTCPECRSRLR